MLFILKMSIADILDCLLSIIETAGVQIKKENMAGSGGGLCRLKTKTVYYLDIDAAKINSAIAAARAVDDLIDIETIYLRPEVRDFVSKYAKTN